MPVAAVPAVLATWRVIVGILLLLLTLWLWGQVRENRQLKDDLRETNEALEALETRTAATEAAIMANDAFDEGVRAQTNTVRVVVDQARRDPDAAPFVNAVLPAAVRGRVFVNDDPTDTASDPRVPAPR